MTRVPPKGGILGQSGSVAYQFERKGEIIIDKAVCADEDELMMAVADAGGDDYEDAEDQWIVSTDGNTMMSVKNALVEAGIEVKGAEVVMEPTNPTDVDP